MLSLMLALLLQEVPSAEPPPEVAEEIVVLSTKLDASEIRIRREGGEFRCNVRRSSGDESLDAVRCDAFRYCAMQIDGQVQALADLDLSRRERDSRVNALAQSLGPCAEDYEDAVLTRMAWERTQSPENRP